MVFLTFHVSCYDGRLRRQFYLIFLQLQTWHQLDEIAARVNVYRADGIVPESFLTPSFLKYFPMVMEPGLLTDVNWNNISGLFVGSQMLPMMHVDNDVLLAMSKQQVWETGKNDVPESFLTPSFLKYFPVVMEQGVLTDVNWNNIAVLLVQSAGMVLK